MQYLPAVTGLLAELQPTAVLRRVGVLEVVTKSVNCEHQAKVQADGRAGGVAVCWCHWRTCGD